jgi:hypothetical protein
VSEELRKALVFQMLAGFEPKRSNRAKHFNKNALTRQRQNYNTKSPQESIHIDLAAISTVGGN